MCVPTFGAIILDETLDNVSIQLLGSRGRPVVDFTDSEVGPHWPIPINQPIVFKWILKENYFTERYYLKKKQ